MFLKPQKNVNILFILYKDCFLWGMLWYINEALNSVIWIIKGKTVVPSQSVSQSSQQNP